LKKSIILTVNEDTSQLFKPNLFILLIGTDCPINNEEHLIDTNSDDELENDEFMVD